MIVKAGSVLGVRGRWQKISLDSFGTALMPKVAYTMAHDTLVGHKDVQSSVDEILVSHHIANYN